MSRGQLLIVGIDFSEGSAAALQRARQLARHLDGRLELLHVSDAVEPDAWRGDAVACSWLEAGGFDAKELNVRQGVPWVEIARRAAEAGATLLVVGTHGRSGYQPLAIGATALKLTLTAPCPVTLVNARGSRPLFSTPARSLRGWSI